MTNCVLEIQGGTFLDLNDPQPEDIHIEHIAHGLANVCRYSGHTSRFYSVAEHSVILSYLVPEEYRLEALMHDAAEAYIGDIPTPLKHSILSPIIEVENNLMRIMGEKFGFDPVMPDAVKTMDRRLATTEQMHLIDGGNLDHPAWGDYKERYPPIDGEAALFCDTIFENVDRFVDWKKIFLEEYNTIKAGEL